MNLREMIDQQKQLAEIRRFARFIIDGVDSICPTTTELEELEKKLVDDARPLTPEVLVEMGFRKRYDFLSKAIGENELQLANRYPAVESKTSWNAWASDKQDEECVFLRTVETGGQLQRLVNALTE